MLGILGAHIWTRDEVPTPPYQGRAFEDPQAKPSSTAESLRWQGGAETAAETLAGIARRVVSVGDREGDIYPLFARRPAEADLLIRANHDRKLALGSGPQANATLFSAPAAWPELGGIRVRVAPRGLIRSSRQSLSHG